MGELSEGLTALFPSPGKQSGWLRLGWGMAWTAFSKLCSVLSADSTVEINRGWMGRRAPGSSLENVSPSG